MLWQATEVYKSLLFLQNTCFQVVLQTSPVNCSSWSKPWPTVAAWPGTVVRCRLEGRAIWWSLDSKLTLISFTGHLGLQLNRCAHRLGLSASSCPVKLVPQWLLWTFTFRVILFKSEIFSGDRALGRVITVLKFKNFEVLNLDIIGFYSGSLKTSFRKHLRYRDFTFMLNSQIRNGVLLRQEYSHIFRKN